MKQILVSFGLLAGLLSPFALGAAANAQSVFGDACNKNSDSVICQQVKNPEKNTKNFVQNVIGTLLFALGILCVIVIIIGGIRYATSNGDQAKIKQAKDVILYAVIGLIVALLAFGIVNFVIDRFE